MADILEIYKRKYLERNTNQEVPISEYRRLLEGGSINRNLDYSNRGTGLIMEDHDEDEEDAEASKVKRMKARQENHLSVKTANKQPQMASTPKRRKTDKQNENAANDVAGASGGLKKTKPQRRKTDKAKNENDFDLSNPFQYVEEIKRLQKKLRNESADIQIEELINGIVALKIMEMNQSDKSPFLECVPLQENAARTEWRIVDGVLREVSL